MEEDDPAVPTGLRTAGQRAITYGMVGAGLAVVAVGALLGTLDTPGTLRDGTVKVITPPLAAYCLLRAGREAWVALRQQRKSG